MNDISLRIRTLLEKGGISAAQLADNIEVQRSTLSHVFSGRNKPSLDLVLKIAQWFNVDLNWLILGKSTKMEGELDLFTNVNSVLTKETTQKDGLTQNIDLFTSPKALHMDVETALNTSSKMETVKKTQDALPLEDKEILKENIIENKALNINTNTIRKNHHRASGFLEGSTGIDHQNMDQENVIKSSLKDSKEIKRVLFFYSDGTFKEYKPDD